MATTKIKTAIRVFLNLCIIAMGQVFLFAFVVITAILPVKCPRCNIRLALDFEKGTYPGIKKCPHCGERNLEM